MKINKIIIFISILAFAILFGYATKASELQIKTIKQCVNPKQCVSVYPYPRPIPMPYIYHFNQKTVSPAIQPVNEKNVHQIKLPTLVEVKKNLQYQLNKLKAKAMVRKGSAKMK